MHCTPCTSCHRNEINLNWAVFIFALNIDFIAHFGLYMWIWFVSFSKSLSQYFVSRLNALAGGGGGVVIVVVFHHTYVITAVSQSATECVFISGGFFSQWTLLTLRSYARAMTWIYTYIDLAEVCVCVWLLSRSV